MAARSDKTLQLLVVTPEHKGFEGQVEQVIVPANDGYMGFLPGHYPLLGVLGTGELTYDRQGQRHYMAISGGLIEVQRDTVRVLADIAETAEQIDIERAGRSIEQARRVLRSQTRSRLEAARASASLQKAISRTRVAKKARGLGDRGDRT
jgi:F-type H+-transporting ATPase subunit epsilon